MTKQKKKRIVLLILSILLTLATAAVLAALPYIIREMRHERLTYSQWYDGALSSVYNLQFAAVGLMGLTLAAWYFCFRKPDAPPLSKGRKAALTAGLCLFAAALFALLYLALQSGAALQEAVSGNWEGIAGYVAVHGKYRVAALLALMGTLLCAYPLLRKRKP